MALKFPDRLESNNPAAYGVVKANQVSGHKTVNTVENLYTLADAILSDSGAGNDAIGQRWYVVSENCYYELVNWTNRKTSTGWIKIYTDSDIQTKLDTKVDKIPGKSLVDDTEINKLKELPNKSTLDSQIAEAKQAGTSAQNNLTSHINNTENPHNVTKEQLKLGNVTNDAQVKRIEMGVAGGVATLGGDGKVPSAQLPSFVDDVIEAANQTAFPETGEAGKIYVALDTNLTYRWGGSGYVEISQSLALGETASTAYAGDKGKKLADDFNAYKINAQAALNKKVDKVDGKQLSTNDYTTEEKNKLAGLSNYDDTTVKQDIANLKTNKLDSSAYTAQDVLNKLKTVDGAGSGLEADIIDWSRVQNKPNIGWAVIE